MDTGWMANGNCSQEPPSTFFPSDGVGVIAAQRICADCPVKPRCLEYALENRIEHGVWGGASERQRRRLLKKRKLPVVADERSRPSDGPGRVSDGYGRSSGDPDMATAI